MNEVRNDFIYLFIYSFIWLFILALISYRQALIAYTNNAKKTCEVNSHDAKTRKICLNY